MGENKKTTKLKDITMNILKDQLLRSIFIVTIIISLAMPILAIFYIAPAARELITGRIVDEAERTGSYLTKTYLKDMNKLNSILQNKTKMDNIFKGMDAFKIKKIKILSLEGALLFSTDKDDKKNSSSYKNILSNISKGEVVSKIGRENADSDLLKIYIPLKQDGKVANALEIVYKIDGQLVQLDRWLFSLMTITVLASFIIFLSLILILLKAGKARTERSSAKKNLKNLNASLAEQIERKTFEIEITQKTSIEALAVLAEYFDEDTGEHLARIQAYVRVLGKQLKTTSAFSEYLAKRPKYIDEMALASLLHDIGKTAIPKQVLTKPGKLNREEFEIMQSHTIVAGELLARANSEFLTNFKKDSYLALARDIALHHHERWNGRGYPYGFAAESIPLSARIVALADVYDALRTRRPYKDPWPHQKIVTLIKEERGEHFDPEVVDAFLHVASDFEEISRRIS